MKKQRNEEGIALTLGRGGCQKREELKTEYNTNHDLTNYNLYRMVYIYKAFGG